MSVMKGCFCRDCLLDNDFTGLEVLVGGRGDVSTSKTHHLPTSSSHHVLLLSGMAQPIILRCQRKQNAAVSVG